MSKLSSALGHGTEYQSVVKEFRLRSFSHQLLLSALRLHAEDLSAALVHVAHYVSHEVVRNGDLQLHHRLKETGLGFYDALLECQGCRDLEGDFVGVYIVVGTVVEDRLDVLDLTAGERTLLHAFSESLFDCRHVVLRNGSAEQFL